MILDLTKLASPLGQESCSTCSILGRDGRGVRYRRWPNDRRDRRPPESTNCYCRHRVRALARQSDASAACSDRASQTAACPRRRAAAATTSARPQRKYSCATLSIHALLTACCRESFREIELHHRACSEQAVVDADKILAGTSRPRHWVSRIARRRSEKLISQQVSNASAARNDGRRLLRFA